MTKELEKKGKNLGSSGKKQSVDYVQAKYHHVRITVGA